MNQEIRNSLRHNITVNLLDGGFFGLAIGFASYTTILPLFVSTMTNSAILIGLIPAIHSASWQLPQLFMANRIKKQSRYKPSVLLMTIHERIPFVGLAVVAWLAGQENNAFHLDNRAVLALTFVMVTWQSLGAGVTANAWQSLMAKIIPGERLGTFFGAQASAANILASVSAILAGLILQRLPSPTDFILCFLLCFGSMVFSWWMLALTVEPDHVVPEPQPGAGSFWQDLVAILRRDRNFRWYLVARALSPMGLLAYAFYSVYAVRIHGVSEAEIGVMTSVLLGTQILANPLMGWIGDHWSRRRLVEIGMLCAVFSALLAWWAPSSGWFYPVFVLEGISIVAVWTVGLALTLEFGSEAERPAYIGLANTLTAPVYILAPFLGGWLADLAGYPAAFLASAAGGLAAMGVFHFLVKDQGKRRIEISEW